MTRPKKTSRRSPQGDLLGKGAGRRKKRRRGKGFHAYQFERKDSRLQEGIQKYSTRKVQKSEKKLEDFT